MSFLEEHLSALLQELERQLESSEQLPPSSYFTTQREASQDKPSPHWEVRVQEPPAPLEVTQTLELQNWPTGQLKFESQFRGN